MSELIRRRMRNLIKYPSHQEGSIRIYVDLGPYPFCLRNGLFRSLNKFPYPLFVGPYVKEGKVSYVKLADETYSCTPRGYMLPRAKICSPVVLLGI